MCMNYLVKRFGVFRRVSFASCYCLLCHVFRVVSGCLVPISVIVIVRFSFDVFCFCFYLGRGVFEKVSFFHCYHVKLGIFFSLSSYFFCLCCKAGDVILSC